ncbi:TetR/AcrR family transcriptional regulator [Paenibacillus donghaensis]|uniref:TetR family transcriptional regulator n=1 Tax=Paenibacillus donghaensis TaxID=414771 RepID=A0A2Z2KL61_9BACL|nr:TetR/AcrR family transcriptional regulator [Paenibacillus donghaensis]ASA21772.1 TetR family transcriptional regulator [Paenibacillus donghaensis]
MNVKKGRPRNLESQQSILKASYELLFEEGFGAVTVEKIAERAGVSKATIYKWWPNKAAVVMDGFLSDVAERLPLPDTGSVFQDIVNHATVLVRYLTSREGKVLAELAGEAQFDPGLAEAYRSRYFQPRRREAGQLLQRGMDRGELPAKLDIGLSIDLIYGPIFYRLLLTGEQLDDAYVQSLVQAAFEGFRSK